jgi:succinate dehydrogenase / fumarate reductase membrane anchor subunit
MGNGTSIGRVRGLGSAHSGAKHWIQERLSGLASLIVSLYLLFSLLMLPALNYQSVKAWISSPVAATAMVLFVVINFWHARSGLRVVIEDYQHDASKLFYLVALDFAAVAGGAFGVLSIVRLALGA